MVVELSDSVKTAYREFLCTAAGVSTYKWFQRCLYGTEDSLVDRLQSNLLPKLLPIAGDGELRVLDVGSGDGHRIDSICASLQIACNREIQLTLIEPSPVFARELDHRHYSFRGWTRLKSQRFEETSLGACDIAFFIHSIFAMEPRDLLERLRSLVHDGSTVVIVSNSDGSLLARLKQIVDQRYEDSRLEVGLLNSSLYAAGYNVDTIDFTTIWKRPVADLESMTWRLGDWLALGKYETLSAKTKQRFAGTLADNAVRHGDSLTWSEAETVLIIRRHESSGKAIANS